MKLGRDGGPYWWRYRALALSGQRSNATNADAETTIALRTALGKSVKNHVNASRTTTTSAAAARPVTWLLPPAWSIDLKQQNYPGTFPLSRADQGTNQFPP